MDARESWQKNFQTNARIAFCWKATERIKELKQALTEAWASIPHNITRMHSDAQLDGRLLLPLSECYWVVNASPLNYGRWVGQNSGPIFSHLWTKVYQIKFACPVVSIVCNAIFRSMMSCCVLEIHVFVIKSRSCPKMCQNFMFLCHQISGEGASKVSDQI